jgi:hypothetical protein
VFIVFIPHYLSLIFYGILYLSHLYGIGMVAEVVRRAMEEGAWGPLRASIFDTHGQSAVPTPQPSPGMY